MSVKDKRFGRKLQFIYLIDLRMAVSKNTTFRRRFVTPIFNKKKEKNLKLIVSDKFSVANIRAFENSSTCICSVELSV